MFSLGQSYIQPEKLYDKIVNAVKGNISPLRPLFNMNTGRIKTPIYEMIQQRGGYAKSKLLKNVSAKYKKTKRGKKLIKQSKKRKNKNT